MKPGSVRARGAYGRQATVDDWIAGKDFQAVEVPTQWVGGQYFSIRDRALLISLGVRTVVLERTDTDETYEVKL